MLEKAVLEDLYLTQRLSSYAISKKFGVNDRTVRKWLEKYDIPRRTISEAITKYHKTDFNENLGLTAYILGLRAGDVHAKRIHKIIRIQTTTTHPAQVQMLEKTFGGFSHVGKHLFFNKAYAAHQWFVYCDLNESFSFILQKPDTIPQWIIVNDDYFYNFLAAYSDCEGSWKFLKSHENGVRLVFQLCSQDREILVQLVAGLEERKYTPHIYLDVKAGITKHGKKMNRDLYKCVLYKRQDVVRLAGVLLSLSRHQEKINKMKLVLSSRGKNWKEVEKEYYILQKEIQDTRT